MENLITHMFSVDVIGYVEIDFCVISWLNLYQPLLLCYSGLLIHEGVLQWACGPLRHNMLSSEALLVPQTEMSLYNLM